MAAVNRRQSAQSGIFIHGFINFPALHQTSRIDDDIVLAIDAKWGVNRIPRCPGDVADDGPLIAKKAVGQGRLSDIRPTDQAEGNRVFVDVLVLLREQRNRLIKQIADADAMGSRNGNRGSEAQFIEVRHVSDFLDVIDFIDRQNNRFFALEEQFGDKAVVMGQTQFAIDDEKDDIGLFQSDIDLGPDFFLKWRVFYLNSTSIDDGEFFGQPSAFPI